jgi:hypothetical protein
LSHCRSNQLDRFFGGRVVNFESKDKWMDAHNPVVD